MNSVNMNLSKLFFDKRISLPEVSKRAKIPYQTLWNAFRQGKVTITNLRKIEKYFGDCTDYIISKAPSQN